MRGGCRRSFPRDLLSGFDACCADGGTFGRLEVAGLGRQHDAGRVRGADRDPGERARLRPVQPLSRLCARADRLARLALAQPRLSHRLPAPVRPRLFPARPDACRRSASRPFSASRASAVRGGRPTTPIPELAQHVLRVLDAEGPRRLHLCDHDGQSRPLARSGASDRSRAAAAISIRRGCRRAASCCAISTACADRTKCCRSCCRGCSIATRDAVLGFLRRPPPEPAPRLPPFRLRRVGQRLCRVAPRCRAASAARFAGPRPAAAHHGRAARNGRISRQDPQSRPRAGRPRTRSAALATPKPE